MAGRDTRTFFALTRKLEPDLRRAFEAAVADLRNGIDWPAPGGTLGSAGGFGIAAGSLTKSGAAALTITNANTYAADILDQAVAMVEDWCAMTADNAPLTLRALKRTVNELIRDPSDRDMASVEAAIAACYASEDYREGARAFMEKRKPAFKGA